MFKPIGIYSAMLTPFNAEGKVNESVLREMVDFMIERGLHGLFPVSTSGEFPHLSFEESVDVMRIVVEQAAGRVKVTPGVSATCADNTIALAEKAKALGCDGVVICPPYYYKMEQDNIAKHYEVVAAAVDLPIILYNIPSYTTPMSAAVVEQLSHVPNIVSIKDSSGSMVDLLHIMDRVQRAKGDMSFLVGREDMLAPALMMGANGCMTACSHIIPEIIVGIWDAVQAGDLEKAKRLQFAILPLIRAMFAAPFPAGFKAALEVRGFDMGPLKQSFADSQLAVAKKIKGEIEKLMPVLLDLIDKEGLDKSKH